MLTQEGDITAYHVDTLLLLLVQNKDQPFACLDVGQGTQNYTQ